MKRAAILGGLLLLVSCSTAQALPRWSVLFGGGASIPMGDFADYAKTGWQGMAGVAWHNADWPVAIRTEFVYGTNKHEGDFDEATNVYGPLLSLVYRLNKDGEMKVRPYILGSVGALNHHYDAGTTGFENESEWKAAFGAGAGVGITAGERVSVFFEGRYLTRDGTNFIPLLAGVHITLQ